MAKKRALTCCAVLPWALAILSRKYRTSAATPTADSSDASSITTDETEAESRIDRQSLAELPPERLFYGYLLKSSFSRITAAGAGFHGELTREYRLTWELQT